MVVRKDFLEAPPKEISKEQLDLSRTNMLLDNILFELRKNVPKVSCDVIVNPIIPKANQPYNVGFQYQNNKVKSLYTIIVNGSKDYIRVGINKSLNTWDYAGSDVFGDGISINTNNINAGIPAFLVLPDVEVEFLTIQPSIAAPINQQSGAFTTGIIWVYAWTIPEYRYISTRG